MEDKNKHWGWDGMGWDGMGWGKRRKRIFMIVCVAKMYGASSG